MYCIAGKFCCTNILGFKIMWDFNFMFFCITMYSVHMYIHVHMCSGVHIFTLCMYMCVYTQSADFYQSKIIPQKGECLQRDWFANNTHCMDTLHSMVYSTNLISIQSLHWPITCTCTHVHVHSSLEFLPVKVTLIACSWHCPVFAQRSWEDYPVHQFLWEPVSKQARFVGAYR